MQPYLIIGSSEKNRIHKVEEIAGKKISKLENNPDFLLLEATETSIGIEEVRNLQKNISFKPYQEDTKIALIKEAQNLTVEAQNALLKTLEEPPDTVQIILTVPNSSMLIPTIISRCHLVDLGAEKQIAINKEDSKYLNELLLKIMSSTCGARLKIIEKEGITKDRATAIEWLDKLTFFTREKFQPSKSDPSPHIVISSYLHLPILSYLYILQLISQTKKYLNANCNVKLAIDNFLLELPSKPC